MVEGVESVKREWFWRAGGPYRPAARAPRARAGDGQHSGIALGAFFCARERVRSAPPEPCPAYPCR